MDKEAMVSIDVTTGSEILDILDKSKIKVDVALWAYLSEYGDWRKRRLQDIARHA